MSTTQSKKHWQLSPAEETCDCNKSSSCGCFVHMCGDEPLIEYCSIHASAPELVAACRVALDVCERTSCPEPLTSLLRAVLARAKGEGRQTP